MNSTQFRSSRPFRQKQIPSSKWFRQPSLFFTHLIAETFKKMDEVVLPSSVESVMILKYEGA